MKKWEKPELIVIESVELSETVLDYSIGGGTSGLNEDPNHFEESEDD